MYDFTFGLSATIWIVIGLIAGAIGWKMIGLGLSNGQLKAMKVAAVVSLLIATVSLGWWATTPTTPEGTLVPEGQGTFNVNVVGPTGATGTHIIKMSDYYFKVLVNTDVHGVGTPFPVGNITGWCNLTVTTTRADTNVNDAYIISQITDVGTATNVTTSTTYDGIAKAVSGDYRVNYTNSAVTITLDSIMQPRASLMRADTYTVRILSNVNAIVALPLVGSYTVTLMASGVPVTIEFVHNTNT